MTDLLIVVREDRRCPRVIAELPNVIRKLFSDDYTRRPQREKVFGCRFYICRKGLNYLCNVTAANISIILSQPVLRLELHT
jgi:hypothetical protein